MTALLDELVDSAHTLARLGLVTAFGHVSVRNGDEIVITPARALSEATAETLVRVPVGADALPQGAPAESWLHLAIYRGRPSVQSIVRAQPDSSLAVGATVTWLVPFFGQMAWLGSRITVFEQCRLVRTSDLAGRAAAALGDGQAMILRGNGAVTTGRGPGDAAARMWLLDLACRSYLDARDAGPRSLDPAELESWQSVEGELVPRLWAFLRQSAGPVGAQALA